MDEGLDVADVQEELKRLGYTNGDKTREDIVNAMKHFRDLKVQSGVFKKERLFLYGTIPIHFRSAVFHIPIRIWLRKDHPDTPPIPFVKPTESMIIRESKHVDKTGLVYAPYLHDWSDRSDLCDFIQLMCVIFSEQPPVYMKKAGDRKEETNFVGENIGMIARAFPMRREAKKEQTESIYNFPAAEERHVQEILQLRQCLEKAKRERDETLRHSLRREEAVARMQEASATLRTRACEARSENEQLKIRHKSEVTELRAAAEEKARLVDEREMELITARRTIDELRTECQRQQTLLCQMDRRIVNMTRTVGEKDAQIKKLKEHSNFLKIPMEDVQLTRVQLGRGSYGEVRIGRWRGSLVAVKMFYEMLQGDHYHTLFHREMEMCARVRHPNIVSICGVTTVDDTPLRIISNLLEGSLSDVIKVAPFFGGDLTLKEKTDLGIGFLAGISYLHCLPTPILHGDIRSTNVLVTATMEAQVGDLGSARFAGASLSAGPHSPEYIAPERNEGHGNTAKADVYSLGVTLAEAMTCKEPNREERHTQVGMIQHEEIRDLCLQMIDDTPTERPKAQACLEALQVVCSTPEYRECPPKRLVRGKAHGRDRVTLSNSLEELS